MIISAAEVLRQEGRVAGLAEGRIEGRMEGRAEGRVEGLEEVAMNLLQDGMKPEKVAKITKLNKNRVQMLRRETNNTSGH